MLLQAGWEAFLDFAAVAFPFLFMHHRWFNFAPNGL
jgi:hypothetical protein